MCLFTAHFDQGCVAWLRVVCVCIQRQVFFFFFSSVCICLCVELLAQRWEEERKDQAVQRNTTITLTPAEYCYYVT